TASRPAMAATATTPPATSTAATAAHHLLRMARHPMGPSRLRQPSQCRVTAAGPARRARVSGPAPAALQLGLSERAAPGVDLCALRSYPDTRAELVC
ncbi:MAG: hypothetical protein M3O70_24755, partial [Actinomycetota bacterium]|nr:hypothetical protein [Actinomycetota bacterium]